MYTVTIQNKSLDFTARQNVLTVEFNNGTHSFSKQVRVGYDYDNNDIALVLKREVEVLTEVEANHNAITTGVIDVTSATEPEPTQAEKDKALWLERDAQWEQVQKAIDKGYVPADNAKVVQLQTWLRNNFKAEYINLV